jgi:hypothetical protein
MNFHTEYHNQRTKYAEELFDKKNSLPHRYVLILTNKCNLACSFCFQERKRFDSSTDGPTSHQVMEPSTSKKLNGIEGLRWIAFGQLDHPPNGGWGWVVVLSSFCIHFFAVTATSRY